MTRAPGFREPVQQGRVVGARPGPGLERLQAPEIDLHHRQRAGGIARQQPILQLQQALLEGLCDAEEISEGHHQIGEAVRQKAPQPADPKRAEPQAIGAARSLTRLAPMKQC